MKLVNDLKDKVARLEKELASANKHIQFLSQVTEQPKAQVEKQPLSETNNNNMYSDHQKPAAKRQPKVEKMNESEMQQNAAQNVNGNASSGQVFRGLDHETLCEKLKETVDMIKELHGGNKTLRENVQSLTELKNSNENENFHLQNENRDLREKIEMLENVIGAQSYDLN